MLAGVERLMDLVGPQTTSKTKSAQEIEEAVRQGDVNTLTQTDGHFAAAARDGKTVRLARTIGFPLRYFVAKMYHGPLLVASDRIDSLYEWCRSQKIGWQFDPLYTRMVPAHYLLEIDQVGCPDPAPRAFRFFTPSVGQGTPDVEAMGAAYVGVAFAATRDWLETVPMGEPVAVAFSGGIDSTSVLLLARHVQTSLHRDPDLIRPFTLDLGGGTDVAQAERAVQELGIAHTWEAVRVDASRRSLEEAIAVIEDYHPLDVECAAAGLCLLGAVRERHPSLRYFLDGDGGDENLKSYPLEDSDLTISSVLRNPLLYLEGWGVDAIKHSLTYSGGLSRAYVRTYAPARKYGFTAFSPYTARPAIAEALALPFEQVIENSAERLYMLKQNAVRAGVRAVTGIEMPVNPKRRFQDGAGGMGYNGAGSDTYKTWRVSKAWCRQVFLRQWESRLSEAWNPEAERLSGNDITHVSVPLAAR